MSSVHKCLIDIVQYPCSYKYLKFEKPSGFNSVRKTQEFKLISYGRTVLSHVQLCFLCVDPHQEQWASCNCLALIVSYKPVGRYQGPDPKPADFPYSSLTLEDTGLNRVVGLLAFWVSCSSRDSSCSAHPSCKLQSQHSSYRGNCPHNERLGRLTHSPTGLDVQFIWKPFCSQLSEHIMLHFYYAVMRKKMLPTR